MKTQSIIKNAYFKVWAGSLALTTAVLLTPLSTAEAATTGTTVSSNVGSVIGLLSSSGTVNIDAIPTSSGVQSTAADTVTVSTNNAAGYTLKLAETSAQSTLLSGSNTIPATANTYASPGVLAVNTWGYHVDGLGTMGTGGATQSSAALSSVKYTFVPATASPVTLKTTATTATNDTTAVWYSTYVNTATVNGTYTNNVTYTATTN